MSLKFLHLQHNLKKKYVIYLYRRTLKEITKFQDNMLVSYLNNQVKKEYKIKAQRLDQNQLFTRFKLAEVFLQNLVEANKDFKSVEFKRLLRIAYNQSSVMMRRDYDFVEASRRRHYGIGIQNFNEVIDYKQKTLYMYLLDRVMNKGYSDKVDEQVMLDYFSEKKENLRDDEVLRPIPLRHEQNIKEIIKYSPRKLSEVYIEIFKITSALRPVFVDDLEIKPDHSTFWRAVKTKKKSKLVNIECPDHLYN